VKYRAGHTLRRAGKTAGNYGKELFLCVLFDAKKSGERERELDKDKKVSLDGGGALWCRWSISKVIY
jgi:hypothetical protein